jgi:predicted dehydrogenase
MSEQHRLTRRDFLRQTRNAALAGVSLAVPNIFLNQTRAATGENPSELVRVGFIGVGGQGTSNMNALMKHAVAVCDVDQKHLAAAKRLVETKNPGRTCAAFGDYRKLLESRDIDAVLISTPDHWHTLPAIHACQAGKDVYCEKPLTLTIEEGRALVKAARKYHRIVQTGSQQRSDPKFLKACELIRSGYIGKVKTVKVGLPGVNYAERAKPLTVPDSDPPPELDYDMWLGPAPWRPYNKHRVHYLFRFYWDYSGGQMTNWGAHHLDITQWALGMDESGPVEIEAIAEFNKDKLYETPQTFDITYRYANGAVVLCNSGGGKYKMGARFEGEKGVLYVNRGALESEPEAIVEQELKDSDTRLYRSRNHHQNWIECIKSRKPPICEVAIGHRSATVCHLGNIAIQAGRKLQWDPAKEQLLGEPVNVKQYRYDYRAPWKLPMV